MFSPKEQFSNFSLFSFTLTISNSTFYFLVAASLLTLLPVLSHKTNSTSSTKGGLLLGSNWKILTESFYHTVLNKVTSFIGKNYVVYFPLFYTLFYLILFSNFIGLIPYSFTPTVEVVFTLTKAITLILGALILAVKNQQFYLLAAFLPAGTPLALIPLKVILEIIALVFRTVSLGLRLAINLITGHVLAKVGVSFVWSAYAGGTNFLIILIPIVLLTVYLALEILIAYLQSYIFIFITCLTFKDLS
jgi:F-type H+-transporting ATPase subunit a